MVHGGRVEGSHTGQKGPSDSTIATQNQLTQEQLALGQRQQDRADKLFNLTEPGLEMTESFYKALASGDPAAIQKATAPATEQIAARYGAAKENIADNMPRGGAKDLALQEADISKSAQISGTQAQAYLGSFPALASLAGEGIGLSLNEVSAALSAFSGASSSNQAGGQMEGAGKAQTLGFIASLGQSAATGAGLAVACWIAEVIFGERDLRTVRLRVFLNDVWAKESLVGRGVMWLYRRYGRWVAAQAKKRRWLRRLLTPLFKFADHKAYEWELRQYIQIYCAGLT